MSGLSQLNMTIQEIQQLLPGFGDQISEPLHHDGLVGSLVPLLAGSFASCSWDCTVRVWADGARRNMQSRVIVNLDSRPHHRQEPMALCCLPDSSGDALLVGLYDGTVIFAPLGESRTQRVVTTGADHPVTATAMA